MWSGPGAAHGARLACVVLGIFLALGLLAKAEEFKKFSYDGVNPEGQEYPSVTWNVVRGSAGPGTYYVTTSTGSHSTSHEGRCYVVVNANGSMTTRDLSNNVVTPTFGPYVFGNRTGGYPAVGYTVRSGSFTGTILSQGTFASYTWDAAYTVVAFGQPVNIPKPREYTIPLVPTPPMTFYIGIRNKCQESRAVALQVGSSVELTGGSTTVYPPGTTPALTTFQDERVAAVGETWAWFIGNKPVASGIITAAQVEAGTVDAGEVVFDCVDEISPDSDLDGVPDDQDTDRDGDGIPNDRDLSPDGNDLDRDGVPDNLDADDDGDGIGDIADPTPRGGPDSNPNDGTKTPPPPSTGGSVIPPGTKPPLTGNPGTGLDVYDDVKAALEDVAAQTQVPGLDGTVNLGDQPEGIGEKAAMSRIDSNVAAATNTITDSIMQGLEMFTPENALQVPQGVGKKSWWDMTFNWIDGSTKTVRIDMAPYDGTVQTIRNLCLLVNYILVWWFSIKTIRGGIA